MAIADDEPAKAPKPTSPEEFVKIYGPVASQVGKEIGVDPRVILGQWGMETRWGSAIIGEHNLGNIKDPSGKGKRAEDKKEGSNDPYLSFESPEGFGRYYSDFIQRGFPNAVGAGTDLSKFTQGLAGGVNGSYFGKTPLKEYESALTGGFNSASKIYSEESQAEAAPNPFGEPGELPPDINKMPPSARPNLQDMPEAYQRYSRVVRDNKGDISGATLGTAGALTGLATQALGGKGLKEAEAAVTNAKAAYESARAAASAASGASTETAQRLAQEAARLEQEYRASQTAFQALERELAEATAKSTQYLPPTGPDRAKLPGASGAENYARKMPGQLPPEALLSQVEDMTTGKNPRGMGAGDIAARNAENIARQKQLGMGSWQMTGTGPEQLVLSPEETARRQASMEAGSQRAKALTPQVDTARAEMEARRSALSEAEKVRQRETAAAQRAAREAQTSATAAQAGLKTAKEAAPSGLGKVGAVAQKVPLTGALAGAGVGLSAAEALNRYEKGDTSGAVLSGVQAVLDGMAMLPPGTPVTAFLKGLGIVGGLATTAYDLYRTRQMEEEAKAKQAQQPPQKARGGLTLMR